MSFKLSNLLQAGVATLVLGAAAVSMAPSSALASDRIPEVRPGHDVVIHQPGNKEIHAWCGNGGLYITCHDYNKGTSTTVFVQPGRAPVVMPPPPPKPKLSVFKLFNPETNTTTTRTIVGGGAPVDVVEEGNHLRD